jgi:hypothetical protein
MLKVLMLFILIFLQMSCGHYQFGQLDRALPGGYDRVAIPMFINDTQEVNLESYFTKALREEFERSKLARVTTKADAQVILEGRVRDATFIPQVQVTQSNTELTTPNPAQNLDGTKSTTNNPLPSNTYLSKQYTVAVDVSIILRKVADNSILWRGSFTNSRVYLAPLVGNPRNGLNSVNAIYNQSSRQLTVSAMAKDLMSEAHDRMTENF